MGLEDKAIEVDCMDSKVVEMKDTGVVVLKAHSQDMEVRRLAERQPLRGERTCSW